MIDVKKTVDKIVNMWQTRNAPTASGLTITQEIEFDRLMKSILHRNEGQRPSIIGNDSE